MLLIQNWEEWLIYQMVLIQKSLDTLEKWADRNLRKFSRGKCEVPHLEKNVPVQTGGQLAGKQILQKKDLGLLLEKKLSTRQQCALAAEKANSMP